MGEFDGKIMTEFVGRRSKTCFYLLNDYTEESKAILI